MEYLGILHKHDNNTLKPFIEPNDFQVGPLVNIKGIHKCIHKNISHLTTKLIKLMLVILESYPNNNFNST